MEYAHLSEAVGIRTVSEEGKKGVFEIEGLYRGYGLTLGNALRRALLSSLPGAAVTHIKLKGVPHEFTAIPGVKEDAVEISLNFKKLRFAMHTNEPKILALNAKGIHAVTGADIGADAEVVVMNPDVVLATLTAKDAEFDVEITVERGLGYSAVESRKAEKLPVGVIAIDANFSPVLRVNYTVEDMRVGERTDYNRLRMEIETDGTVSPSAALHKAGVILQDHFGKITGVEVKEFESAAQAGGTAKKKRAKKEQ
ncbi:MAG: DNA-directed RNA polymerase subunit alpha [Candidatus Liptonbacteria bacterium]|nr:DNA-directed RNA polymerase subunit alpha [Candidatus Liptonbacteria bacterium]